ncbi:MAG: hypothetical protein ACXWUX_10355 [Allosphingosinicella sp.]
MSPARAPSGAGPRLARALQAALRKFAGDIEVTLLSSRDWTSITFAGERHLLAVRLVGVGAGAAADQLVEGLAASELDLPGHLLVDIAATADERDPAASLVRLTLSAVTVEAA